MRRKWQIIIGIILIAFFILIAFAAPMLAPNDPNATNLAMKNAEPSAEYPLGCDQMGRCELSRLLYGASRINARTKNGFKEYHYLASSSIASIISLSYNTFRTARITGISVSRFLPILLRIRFMLL